MGIFDAFKECAEKAPAEVTEDKKKENVAEVTEDKGKSKKEKTGGLKAFIDELKKPIDPLMPDDPAFDREDDDVLQSGDSKTDGFKAGKKQEKEEALKKAAAKAEEVAETAEAAAKAAKKATEADDPDNGEDTTEDPKPAPRKRGGWPEGCDTYFTTIALMLPLKDSWRLPETDDEVNKSYPCLVSRDYTEVIPVYDIWPNAEEVILATLKEAWKQADVEAEILEQEELLAKQQAEMEALRKARIDALETLSGTVFSEDPDDEQLEEITKLALMNWQQNMPYEQKMFIYVSFGKPVTEVDDPIVAIHLNKDYEEHCAKKAAEQNQFQESLLQGNEQIAKLLTMLVTSQPGMVQANATKPEPQDAADAPRTDIPRTDIPKSQPKAEPAKPADQAEGLRQRVAMNATDD